MEMQTTDYYICNLRKLKVSNKLKTKCPSDKSIKQICINPRKKAI